jgi:hypothetical protein
MGLMARILALALIVASTRDATCNIPVFRYALERWPAAPYDVLAVHRGSLTDEQGAALNVLRQSGANVEVDRLDVAEPVEARRKAVLEKLKVEAPALIALYPGTDLEAWRGTLTPDAARALVDSPMRREVSRRILEGQSGVWVLLESGDKAADDAAEAMLGKELRGLEQTLKLPAHHPDDPPLLSDLPVRVAFSILRLARTDPQEQPLVAMLEKSERGLKGTIAFPIFGRGRVLWGLAGRGLTADNIAESGVFLTGACSCEAKELNPGVDLLFAADWEAGLSAAPEAQRLPEPLLKPRPPDAPEPAAPAGSSPLLWVVLLFFGFLVALSGRRIYALTKADRSPRI